MIVYFNIWPLCKSRARNSKFGVLKREGGRFTSFLHSSASKVPGVLKRMKWWSDELKVVTEFSVSVFLKENLGWTERIKFSSAGCNNSCCFIWMEGAPMEIIIAIKALGKLENKFCSSFWGVFGINNFLAAVGWKNH